MTLEIADELLTKPSNGRSKYRDIIEDIKTHFDENPEVKVVKISTIYGAEADTLAKKVRDWLTEEDEIWVRKQGKVVYFLRD